MKNLKDSILEKLKVDDISFDKFPIDGTIDDIIEFLRDCGFTIICEDWQSDIFTVRKALNAAKDRQCFVYISGKQMKINFGDTTKKNIRKDNPIFIISCGFVNNLNDCDYVIGTDFADLSILEKNEWIEIVNKRFGWK